MSEVAVVSVAEQLRDTYRRLRAEATAARVSPERLTRIQWAEFRRSPDGRRALARQAGANGRASTARKLALKAYHRMHPLATALQANAWLEDT